MKLEFLLKILRKDSDFLEDELKTLVPYVDYFVESGPAAVLVKLLAYKPVISDEAIEKAAANGQLEVIKLLRKHQYNISNYRTRNEAALNGQVEILEFLLNVFDPKDDIYKSKSEMTTGVLKSLFAQIFHFLARKYSSEMMKRQGYVVQLLLHHEAKITEETRRYRISTNPYVEAAIKGQSIDNIESEAVLDSKKSNQTSLFITTDDKWQTIPIDSKSQYVLRDRPIYGFDPDLYNEVLRLTKAACFFEENEGAETRAYYLTVLCRSMGNVLEYLKTYEQENPQVTQLVHDAVLFNLPSEGEWDIQAWYQLAISDIHRIPKLFVHAEKIEKEIHGDQPSLALVRRECERKVCANEASMRKEYESQYDKKTGWEKALENRINKILSDNKKSGELTDEYVAQLINEEREKAIKKHDDEKIGYVTKKLEQEIAQKTEHLLKQHVAELLEKQNDKFKELGKTEKELRINDFIKTHDLTMIPYNMLLDIAAKVAYSRAQENPSFAYECVEAGVDEEGFDQSLELIKAGFKQNEIIPNIFIDGNQIGYPGYYLEKLDRQNPVGLILGALTHCCQSMGSQGEDCAVHGQTSENGGFYVLKERGKKDKVIAQSWVWVSQNNCLVFDSIEHLPNRDNNIIMAFFETAANNIIQESQFQKVLVGMGGNTPHLPEREYQIASVPEVSKDYTGYRDSKMQQRILASKQIKEESQDLNLYSEERLQDSLLMSIKQSDENTFNLILDYCKNIEVKSSFYDESLFSAIDKGAAKMMESLLDAGAPVGAEHGPFHESLLVYAINKGQDDIAYTLVTKYRLNVKKTDLCGLTPLHHAAIKGSKNICEFLLNTAPELCGIKVDWLSYIKKFQSKYPPELATMYGHIELSTWLREKKEALDAKHEAEYAAFLNSKRSSQYTSDEDDVSSENSDDNDSVLGLR